MVEEIDILDPYVARLGNVKSLSEEEALQVTEDCLNDFKKSMVDRGNIILKDIKIYGKELEKLQSSLSIVSIGSSTFYS